MDREPGIGDVVSFYGDKVIFVVEKEIFDDNHRMWARALKVLKGKDGEIWKYDPKGTLITFWTDDSYDNVIGLKDIKLHGQMKMIFVK